jgi:Tfp pilus assembly protein FimV
MPGGACPLSLGLARVAPCHGAPGPRAVGAPLGDSLAAWPVREKCAADTPGGDTDRAVRHDAVGQTAQQRHPDHVDRALGGKP